jgi:hypothetical protein
MLQKRSFFDNHLAVECVVKTGRRRTSFDGEKHATILNHFFAGAY